jgi:hypothetical protein
MRVPTRDVGQVDASGRQCSSEQEAPASSPIAPFLLGTVVGGLVGAVLGTALSPHTRGYLVGLYHLASRRLTASEREQLRFELLLQ